MRNLPRSLTDSPTRKGGETSRFYKGRGLLRVLVLIVFALIQCALLHYVSIKGIKPDILLLAVVFYALSRASAAVGLGIGILGGLLKDVLSGGVFGIGILCFLALGMLCGYLGKHVYIEHLPIQILAAASAALLTSTLYYLVSILFRSMPPLWLSFRLVIFPAAIYTTLISPFIFRMLMRIEAIVKSQEQRRQRV